MNENYGEHYSSVWEKDKNKLKNTKILLERYKHWKDDN